MRKQKTEHRAQNTEHRTQNTEYRTQNTEYRTQNTEYRQQNTDNRAQTTDYEKQRYSLGSGFWVLGSEKGFTLVELLIAITITAFALAGVYTTFVVQQRSFTTQDQVAEVDLTSKIAFDMIINDIRTAGFGYAGNESPDINNITNIDTTGVIIPNINGSSGLNDSDTITLIGGFRQLTTLENDSGLANQIDIDSPYLSSSFNTSTRSALSIGGLFFAFISSCDDDDNDGNCDADAGSFLTLDRDVPNKTVLVGRPVYLVEDVTYRISGTDLQRVKWINSSADPDTTAENIEDLQFVDIDQDGDGVRDRIRITLLARTAHEDPNLNPDTKPYHPNIALEDGDSINTNDQNRRRIWSMEVGLRN